MIIDFREDLVKTMTQLDIELSEIQIDQFESYFQMLIEKNKVMNLTAIIEQHEVVVKHFADSLTLVKAIPNLNQFYTLIDVGTGAGFPGIPLKIVFPKLQVTLLDSLNKRVGFLNEVITELKLDGITAVHGRAEDFGRDMKFRDQFDLCVSRAVANLAILVEYDMPFVKVGGYFIPYKSGKVEDELFLAKGAVKLLGGKIEKTTEFLLPGTDMERTLVSIKKIESTSKKYPRKAGIPTKEPLK